MLQKMNERVKGWFAWLIVILVAFTFVLFGIDYYLQTRQPQKSLLEINGENIAADLIEQTYRRLRQNVPHPSKEDEKKLRSEAINELIARTVSEQAAIRHGYHISPEQVSVAITQIPEFQDQGHFSLAKYQQVIHASMYTQNSLAKEISHSMLVNQQHFGIVNTEFLLPNELIKDAALIYEKRDYDYALIDLKSFMHNIVISNNDIKKYYQDHIKQFNLPPRVSLDFVRLNVEDFKKQARQAITKEAVLAYYQENKPSYHTTARWKVSHLLYAFPEKATEAQIHAEEQKAQEAYKQFQKDPLLFNDWVKKYSDDVLSARHEGVLPWLTLKESDLDEALIQLKKPGQISAPIKTNKGYELVKLLEYQPAKEKSFEQVEANIMEQLTQETAQVTYAKALETLGELSYQNPDSLEPVAKALNIKIESTSLFSKNGGSDEITQNKDVIHQTFSADVMDLGNNSEIIQLNPSSVVVVRINKKVGEEAQPLAAVESKIENILKQQAARKQLASLILGIQNGKESLPKGVQWHAVNGEERQHASSDSVAHDLASSLSFVHQVKGEDAPNDKFMLVRLKGIHEGKYMDLSPSQKDSIKIQLQSALGNIVYDLLIQHWIAIAKINKTID